MFSQLTQLMELPFLAYSPCSTSLAVLFRNLSDQCGWRHHWCSNTRHAGNTSVQPAWTEQGQNVGDPFSCAPCLPTQSHASQAAFGHVLLIFRVLPPPKTHTSFLLFTCYLWFYSLSLFTFLFSFNSCDLGYNWMKDKYSGWHMLSPPSLRQSCGRRHKSMSWNIHQILSMVT